MALDPKYKTLTSFSGADLVVNFNNRVIGELQQITYAVHREKAPVYTLGSPDVRSFSRGKRGISGSLVFAVFDRDALYEELKANQTYSNSWYGFTAGGNARDRDDKFFSALSLSGWDSAATAAGGAAKDVKNGTTVIQNGVIVPTGFEPITINNAMYADTLPPFDITMTFANEYGQTAWQKIYDAEVLNEGSGVSVDSIVMERQLTWIARRISPVMTGAYTNTPAATAAGN